MPTSLDLPLLFLLFELALLGVIMLPVLITARFGGMAIRVGTASSLVLLGVLLIGLRGHFPPTVVKVGSQALILLGATLAYRALSNLYGMPLSRFWEVGVPVSAMAVHLVLWVLDDSADQLGLTKPRVFAVILPLTTNAAYWLYRLRRVHPRPWSIGTKYLALGASIAVIGNVARTARYLALPPVDLMQSPVAIVAVAVGMTTSLLLVVGLMLEAQARSLSQLVQSNVRLQHAASTDPLTGVGNRRHLEDEAPRAVALARAEGAKLAFLMCDVDHFKRVNDTFGHEAGDVVLREVARLCRQGLRNHDVLARWGGEEFAILLSHADAEVSQRVAERIRLSVAAASIGAISGQPLTISIGIALLGPDDDIHAAQVQADAALYRAKDEGRNRCVGP